MGSSYSGPQSVLNALLGEYWEKGFRLVESDHTLTLYHQDDLVAGFSATGALIKEVQQECENWLLKIGESEIDNWVEQQKGQEGYGD